MKIRTFKTADTTAVAALLHASFGATDHGYDGEAEIAAKIRQQPDYQPALEVVAVAADPSTIVGYGLMSPVQVVADDQTRTGLVLAPLAVAVDQQQQGIGGAILQELEKRGRQAGFGFVSILGHPTYYPRFGYQPASQYQITAPFPVPDEAFMIKALTPTGLDGVHGEVRYSASFS